jgi:hypothetical protein
VGPFVAIDNGPALGGLAERLVTSVTFQEPDTDWAKYTTWPALVVAANALATPGMETGVSNNSGEPVAVVTSLAVPIAGVTLSWRHCIGRTTASPLVERSKIIAVIPDTDTLGSPGLMGT